MTLVTKEVVIMLEIFVLLIMKVTMMNLLSKGLIHKCACLRVKFALFLLHFDQSWNLPANFSSSVHVG